MRILFVLFLFLSACTSSNQQQMVENTGYAQGTTYQIKYLTDEQKNYGEEIKQMLAEIDSSMSTYISTSIISRVNEGGTFVEVDSLFETVLNRSIEIAEETNGDFDPTIGPLVRLWGFDFEELRKDVTSQMVEDAKSKTGYSNVEMDGSKVRIPKDFSLDFNAIAQGFTVDYIADYLERQGMEHYMVEVGGEVRAKGFNENGNVWKIGVDKPQEEIDTNDRFQFIIELENAALATSGNYRKFWLDEETGTKYAHTIDPKTGRPALNKLLSASIVAPTAMDADAYATVCMVKGLEACKKFISQKDNLEAYLIYSDKDGDWKTFLTEGFESYLVN